MYPSSAPVEGCAWGSMVSWPLLVSGHLESSPIHGRLSLGDFLGASCLGAPTWRWDDRSQGPGMAQIGDPISDPPHFFFFFRAKPVAYESSQARGQIRATATPQPQQHQIWALSATYTTSHGNIESPTLQARSGIEPTSSWILVGFVNNHWATRWTPWPSTS